MYHHRADEHRGSTQNYEGRVNSGTEPEGTCWYSWTKVCLPMRVFRIPIGLRLKITVSPVRIRVPPLIKVLQIAEKRKSPAALPEPRVNSPFEKTPPLARLWYRTCIPSVAWTQMARVILLSYANRSLRLYGPPRLLHVQARGRHRKAGSDAMASTLDSSPSRKLEGPH